MKCKMMILAILVSFAMCMFPQIAKAEMTPEDLWFNQTHLIGVTTHDGDYLTLEYTLRQDEKYNLIVVKNGTERSWKATVDTTNIAYFYLKEKSTQDGVPTYICNLKWFTNANGWQEGGYCHVLRTGFQYEIQPGPPSGQYDHLKGTIRITEPPYDYWNTTESRIKLKYSFGIPKPVGDYDITIIGGGEVVGSNKLVSTNEDDNWKFFYYEVYRDLPDSQNNITISVDQYSYSATRIINRYFGVIDEDGDGIDDRTGLPVGGTGSYLTPEGAPVLPENATIFDYVKYAVDSIIYVFAQTGLTIKGLIGGIGEIGKILTGFFSFMPQPFTGIIVIGLLIAIILRIFGR